MALKSRFATQTGMFRAQKVFTDRVEPRKVFSDSIHRLASKEIQNENKEIIVYYGKGGIGKSKLLKELQERYSEDVYQSMLHLNVHNVFLSLDAYDYSNPVNILLALRSEISGDCSLFDYALIQYYAKSKLTIEEIQTKNSFLSSPVMELLNELIDIGMASVTIPTATISKCISWIRDVRFKAKYKQEIEEISTLNEFEIFERLPYYLGLCVSHAAEKGQVYVVFLDSYESMLAKTSGIAPSVREEAWLQEFFLACDVIRIVIASRDRIGWDKEEPDWKEYLEQHLLHNLSDEDSRWFLEQVPIKTTTGELDVTLISDIVQRAGGVPLYLDMCVDIYTNCFNSGETMDLESLDKGESIIDRYLRHLSSKDKYAVRILSVPRNFELKFAIALLAKQNLIYHENELLELLDKSVFLDLQNAIGLWKVDESVRCHVFERMSFERKQSIIENMLDYVIENKKGSAFSYLTTIIESVEKYPELLEAMNEKMIEAVDYYAQSGYWNELHVLVNKHIEVTEDPLRPIAVYTEIIRLRRTASLAAAQQFADKHPLTKKELGLWHYLYRFFRIQIRHLQGYYDESLEKYQALVDEMKLIRSVIPTHVYNMAAMKYADLLFLKGRFEESLAIVEELLGRGDTIQIDKIELIRIKGHIYRFNKKYTEAAIIYESALELIRFHGLNLQAFTGKIYTNMTEVCCTIRPEEALKWYEKSLEMNEGNDIEIGKSKAAASVAYTKLGNLEKAVSLAREAIASAERVGYKSGRAFGLIALYYAQVTSGDDEVDEVLQKLKKQIEEIKVYEYLLKDIV